MFGSLLRDYENPPGKDHAKRGGSSTAKAFASHGDLAERKISFTDVGRDFWAFTAEGDPNSGVVIGDNGVMSVDAQATAAGK